MCAILHLQQTCCCSAVFLWAHAASCHPSSINYPGVKSKNSNRTNFKLLPESCVLDEDVLHGVTLELFLDLYNLITHFCKVCPIEKLSNIFWPKAAACPLCYLFEQWSFCWLGQSSSFTQNHFTQELAFVGWDEWVWRAQQKCPLPLLPMLTSLLYYWHHDWLISETRESTAGTSA